jgi:hypothetical protein
VTQCYTCCTLRLGEGIILPMCGGKSLCSAHLDRSRVHLAIQTHISRERGGVASSRCYTQIQQTSACEGTSFHIKGVE